MFTFRNSFFLIFCLLLPFASLKAQRAAYKPQVHEFSLQLGAVNAIPALSEYYENGSVASIHPLNGLRYTYHYSISDGFRIGAFRRNATFNYPGAFQPFESYRADKQDWDFHLGYKRMYHMGQSQIFGGADLIYSRGKVEAVATQNGNTFSDAYSYANLGGSLFFGYSFFFNTHLSLTFETEAYFTTIQNRSAIDTPDPLQVYLLEDREAGFNASVYLNFHLVKMKKRCTCPKVRI